MLEDAPRGAARRGVPDIMADRLFVALDVPSIAAADEVVRRLDGIVGSFKIGLWLLFAPGSEAFIDRLLGAGKRLFLDAKMYDIGETVRQGVARAAERGVSFLTVHGDPSIMQAAVEGKGGATTTRILAVTVLTNLDDAAVQRMGYALPVAELVKLRARQAAECGCDGIIASADDDPDAIRAAIAAPGLLIVTPGIRLVDNAADDQKRRATPAQAIARGADFLVVGRPIIRADDPAAAASRIIADMAAGAAARAALPLTGR